MFWNKGLQLFGRKQVPAIRSKSAPVLPAHSQSGRLVFGLDATASREDTWGAACRIQSDMFDAAARVGGLEMKLVFYRGENTCKASAWTVQSKQMRRWMKAVDCETGYTQIERVLSHAIMEARKQRVNAVVFVGDTVEEDPERLVRLAGELGALNVPLFIFQEGTDMQVAATFKRMAELTKGAHSTFDLSSVERLRQLLGGVAVFASGGYDALVDHARRQGSNELLLLASQLSAR